MREFGANRTMGTVRKILGCGMTEHMKVVASSPTLALRAFTPENRVLWGPRGWGTRLDNISKADFSATLRNDKQKSATDLSAEGAFYTSLGQRPRSPAR